MIPAHDEQQKDVSDVIYNAGTFDIYYPAKKPTEESDNYLPLVL